MAIERIPYRFVTSRFGAAVFMALLLSQTGCDGRPPEDLPRQKAPNVEFFSAKVNRRLLHVNQALRTRGFTELDEPWRGFLVEQVPSVRELRLKARRCYVVAAVTSEGAQSVQIWLMDSEGADAMHGVSAHRGAGLRYCPTQSGTFYVVTRSSAGHGLVAEQAFSGPTGLEVNLAALFEENESS